MSVEVTRHDGVVTVTMAWTERRNALGPPEARQVADTLALACGEAEVGVILTGRGAFCAGGDLAQFAALSEAVTADEVGDYIYRDVQAVLRVLRASPVPVIAAVDGPAVGLGLDYSLACDMCMVGPSGWLQQGWRQAGLIHGTGGAAFIERAAPAHVWRLIAEQRRINGPTAETFGLAEATSGSAHQAAMDRLASLASLPRPVLEAYVATVRPPRWPAPAYLEDCARRQAAFLVSEEFRELARTILERPRR